MQPWLKKTIWIAVLVVVLVITYFVLSAFLPRWWAQRMGGLASASMGRGVLWGLLFGTLCTFTPLVMFWFAWRMRRRRKVRWLAITVAVLGLVAAIPNLLTLTVVLGGGSGAHAGERIMDVDAPGFRGASLVGAIAGAVLFAVVVALNVMYRRRGREVDELRTERLAEGPTDPV